MIIGIKLLDQEKKERELLEVILVSEDVIVLHNWEKSNLVTILGRQGSYDEYKCKNCGVTGVRFGLGNEVIRDELFKSKLYNNCTTAKLQMQRLKNRKR